MTRRIAHCEPDCAAALSDGRRHQREEVLCQVADHFDARADNYHQKYSGDRPRHLFEHEKRQRSALTQVWIRDHARRDSRGRLLDVGCGDGHNICQVLAEHAGWSAVGVDVAPTMIQQSRQLTARSGLGRRVEWIIGDANALSETFDVVTALGVVGYQADQLSFVESLAARVAPNGLLIFSFANALSVPRYVRSLVQRSRRRGDGAVRFRAASLRRLDNCLVRKMFSRVCLCWLCFGIGLPHSRREIEYSRWMERRWSQSAWACLVAQVGVVCYRRAELPRPVVDLPGREGSIC